MAYEDEEVQEMMKEVDSKGQGQDNRVIEAACLGDVGCSGWMMVDVGRCWWMVYGGLSFRVEGIFVVFVFDIDDEFWDYFGVSFVGSGGGWFADFNDRISWMESRIAYPPPFFTIFLETFQKLYIISYLKIQFFTLIRGINISLKPNLHPLIYRLYSYFYIYLYILPV